MKITGRALPADDGGGGARLMIEAEKQTSRAWIVDAV